MKKTITCPHCGCESEHDVSLEIRRKKRSLAQNGRFHAIIAAAFHHWPESHWFRPHNEQHLRYWLENQAGNYEVELTFDPSLADVDPDKQLGIIRHVIGPNQDHKFFVDRDESGMLVAKRVRSIAFDRMAQAEFNRVKNDVMEVIEIETGLAPERMLKETESAA